MPAGITSGGGHIDTPLPSKPFSGKSVRRRIDTPDPAHETPPPTPPASEPKIWMVRHRPNPLFFGREDELQQVHDIFQRQTLCHLCGPEGSGTTQTALAYTFRARNAFEAVFWLDGNDSLTLRLEFSEFADGLGLIAQRDLSHEERLKALRRWFETHERWLLIVDGTVDHRPIQSLLPARPAGKVLVVGHTPLGWPGMGVVEHAMMADDQASRYVEHRSLQPNAQGREDLVGIMAGSALSLGLAGSYCHAADVSLSQYQELLTQALSMNPGGAGQNLSEFAILHAATKLSLQYLSEHEPASLELMALCAHFDSQGIPLVTLYDGAPFLPKRLGACVTDPQSLDQALKVLFQLGLIQFETNSISIHPHLQQATRELLGDEQGAAWLMTALRVVLEAFPVESHYAHPIPACTMLVRHALAVTAMAEKGGNLRENTGALLNQLGLYLHACRELDGAQDCFERAIALAVAAFGTEAHPTVAARTNSLGVVYQDQENFEAARNCYQRAFALCEQIYGPARDATMGPAHRSMLTMPSRNLCQVLELMGDRPGAMAAYEKAIETFIEVYCWNHPLVAQSMDGLGQLYFEGGDVSKAQQCFLKAVQAEENAEEPKLGALASYTRDLARCLLEVGQINEAHRFFEHALACDREDFGPVHEHVAADLQGMARTHRARSRFTEAHACLDEASQIWDALIDGPVPAKALLWRQRGRCHLDANDYEDAVAALYQAIQITETAVGEFSPALGPDYVYLGRALGRLERHEEEEKFLVKALQLHESNPWLDDEGLNVLYGRLVRAYRALQNYSRAAFYQMKTLVDNQKRHGAYDDRVGADAYSLGNLHIALGNGDDARYYLRMALDIYRDTRGDDDERTLRVRRKLELVEAAGQENNL